MPQILEGKPQGEGIRVAVVVSRFNETVTTKLLQGAEECLAHHGCTDDRRTVIRVPGAWEIPLVAKKILEQRQHDAVIALGALIRGETAHFEYLSEQVARALGRLGLEFGVPVVFGVLTTYNGEQAVARAGGDHSDKGREAATTAMEMIDLYRRLENR